MWNTAHGPAKAVQMGWRDHILTCGHKHISGYQVLKDPATGLVSHAIRVGSYKIHDRYAAEQGLPNQNIFPAAVTIIDPAHDDVLDVAALSQWRPTTLEGDSNTFVPVRPSGSNIEQQRHQDQQGAASPARAGGSVGGLVFVHWAQGLPADRRALHRFVGKSIAGRETCACIGLKPRRLRLERPPVGRIVPARDSKTLTVVKKWLV